MPTAHEDDGYPFIDWLPEEIQNQPIATRERPARRAPAADPIGRRVAQLKAHYEDRTAQNIGAIAAGFAIASLIPGAKPLFALSLILGCIAFLTWALRSPGKAAAALAGWAMVAAILFAVAAILNAHLAIPAAWL